MKIKWTDANGSATTYDNWASTPTYYIDNVSGLGSPDASYYDYRGPNMHGSALVQVLLQPREISFEIVFRGTSQSDNEGKRKTLEASFSPICKTGLKNLGTLEITMAYGQPDVYTIAAIPQGIALQGYVANGNFNRAKVTFECPDPFFLGALVTETFTSGSAKSLTVTGDVITYPVLKCAGAATSPLFTNGTITKFIGVDSLTVDSGHRLDIDCREDQRTINDVTISGGAAVSVFHHKKSGSEFWGLTPGTNSVTASGGGTLSLTYYPRYLAIA